MARFDTVLEAHAVDPRLRMRLTLSAMAAMALTAFAGAASWTAEHMQVHRVDAPRLDYALLFDFTPPQPPPGASPPPRPNVETAAAEDEPAQHDDEVPPDEVDDDPLDVDLALDPVPRPRGVPGPRDVPGVGGGPLAGGPSHCLVPPCVGTGPIGTGFATPPAVPRVPKPEPAKVMEKIDAVRAHAIYSPDPDRKQLSRTKAATFDRRSGRSAVQFCVSPTGKVVDVRTSGKFGDAEVDRICRETVSAWRFRPFTVDGTARKTCSTVTFDIHFD